MAMPSFHALKVKAVERVAEDATCITVEIPAALREAFSHHAGQYVTVRRTINANDERRTYSIVTAPGAGALKLGIRMQAGGRVSSDIAANLRPGDMLDVGTPMGRFRVAVDPQRQHSYVAFAAGSGITPILSLATDILARETGSRFTLIYGNRSTSRTMFLEEALALKNRYLDRFAVHFVMSREPQQTDMLNGRIDAQKVGELARQIVEISSADEYLICGPGDMVDEVREAIKALNANATIRFERFAPGDSRPVEVLAKACGAGPAEAQVLADISIVMDGRRRSFTMAPSDPSVLAATCRARIIAGAAVMRHNIALERWETDAGFILCCQARPTTATLELSYDDK